MSKFLTTMAVLATTLGASTAIAGGIYVKDNQGVVKDYLKGNQTYTSAEYGALDEENNNLQSVLVSKDNEISKIKAELQDALYVEPDNVSGVFTLSLEDVPLLKGDLVYLQFGTRFLISGSDGDGGLYEYNSETGNSEQIYSKGFSWDRSVKLGEGKYLICSSKCSDSTALGPSGVLVYDHKLDKCSELLSDVKHLNYVDILTNGDVLLSSISSDCPGLYRLNVSTLETTIVSNSFGWKKVTYDNLFNNLYVNAEEEFSLFYKDETDSFERVEYDMHLEFSWELPDGNKLYSGVGFTSRLEPYPNRSLFFFDVSMQTFTRIGGPFSLSAISNTTRFGEYYCMFSNSKQPVLIYNLVNKTIKLAGDYSYWSSPQTLGDGLYFCNATDKLGMYIDKDGFVHTNFQYLELNGLSCTKISDTLTFVNSRIYDESGNISGYTTSLFNHNDLSFVDLGINKEIYSWTIKKVFNTHLFVGQVGFYNLNTNSIVCSIETAQDAFSITNNLVDFGDGIFDLSTGEIVFTYDDFSIDISSRKYTVCGDVIYVSAVYTNGLYAIYKNSENVYSLVQIYSDGCNYQIYPNGIEGVSSNPLISLDQTFKLQEFSFVDGVFTLKGAVSDLFYGEIESTKLPNGNIFIRSTSSGLYYGTPNDAGSYDYVKIDGLSYSSKLYKVLFDGLLLLSDGDYIYSYNPFTSEIQMFARFMESYRTTYGDCYREKTFANGDAVCWLESEKGSGLYERYYGLSTRILYYDASEHTTSLFGTTNEYRQTGQFVYDLKNGNWIISQRDNASFMNSYVYSISNETFSPVVEGVDTTPFYIDEDRLIFVASAPTILYIYDGETCLTVELPRKIQSYYFTYTSSSSWKIGNKLYIPVTCYNGETYEEGVMRRVYVLDLSTNEIVIDERFDNVCINKIVCLSNGDVVFSNSSGTSNNTKEICKGFWILSVKDESLLRITDLGYDWTSIDYEDATTVVIRSNNVSGYFFKYDLETRAVTPFLEISIS